MERPCHLIFIVISMLIYCILTSWTLSWAIPEYSCETGESCIHCHENPDGGETLTTEGEIFFENDYSFDKGFKTFYRKRALKLAFGFLHILFAVIWFGAIFYIHLFVKPASLKSGLPRNERILGWICILGVGLTGVILTTFRLRSLNELWTTTFGIILSIKVSIFVIMVIIAAIATTRINRLMREAYLKEKGDRGGKSTQFIYRGNLYDVSKSKYWKNGIHMGRHHAGNDLTSALSDAPHGAEILERVTHAGSSDDFNDSTQAPAVRYFIFMAYFILFCMLGVLFCIAFWNWGPSLISPSLG